MSSFLPLVGLALETLDDFLFFASKVSSDEGVVVLVVSWVHLSGSVVLELRMLLGKSVWQL